MPFALNAADQLAAKQDVGTDVIIHVDGDEFTVLGAASSYKVLARAALATSAASVYTPAAGKQAIVGHVALTNPGASTRTITLYRTLGSNTYDATTQWGSTIQLPAGYSAVWDGQWRIYNASGQEVLLWLTDTATPTNVTDAAAANGSSQLPAKGDHRHVHGQITGTADLHTEYITKALFAAKGDLIGATGNDTPSILTVGAEGKVLAADSGSAQGLKYVDPILTNFSTANQTGFAADTYLAGSSIAVPAGKVRAGTMYYCRFDMVKTGAGTATPILSIRFGTAGSTADTARLTFTFAVGTGVIDTGVLEVWAHFRNIGASAVLVGIARLTHHLAATGLTTTGASGTAILIVTSGTFDSTVANSIIGASFNGGASFAGTNVLVEAEARNLNV